MDLSCASMPELSRYDQHSVDAGLDHSLISVSFFNEQLTTSFPQPMNSFCYSSHFTLSHPSPYSLSITPTSSMPHTPSFCTLHIPYSASSTKMHLTPSLPQLHMLTPSLLQSIHLQLPNRQWKLVLVLVAMPTLILFCMEAADMYVAHPIAD